MPSKKVFDIAPPRLKSKEPQQVKQLKSSGRGRKHSFTFSPRKLSILGAVFVVVLVFFLVQTLFAFAQVTITPTSREIVLQETVIADPALQGISPEKNALQGFMREQEKSGTKLFSATGKQTQETKAQGTIRVYNNQAKTQVLIATTRFISEEGKLFRSKSRVTIAPNGEVDVDVAAAEAGAEYNIGPSNFSLPGLLGSPLYTVVYGKSFEAMQGGQKNEITVVSEEDIRLAKEAYTAELQNTAKAELEAAVAPLHLVSESLREEVVKMSPSVEKGAEVSQFGVMGTVKVRGLAFSQDDLKNLAKELVAFSKDSNELADERTVQISHQNASFSASTQKAALELEISGKVYQNIDREEIAAKLLGKSKAEAQQVLLDYPTIEKFEFSFFPFWKQTISFASSKLTITLKLPGD